MPKEKCKDIKLTFYQALRIPPFLKEDYESGEALTIIADWRDRDPNKDINIHYRDERNIVYRIERFQPVSDKIVVDMMSLEPQRFEVIKPDGKKYYKIEDPRLLIELGTTIRGKVIEEKNDAIFVRDTKRNVIKLTKVKKLK